MAWQRENIGDLPRQSVFPFRVDGVFYCRDFRRPFSAKVQECKYFEFCFRLRSDAARCVDLIDGRAMNAPFPNIVFKYPGMKLALASDLPRDTLAFMVSPRMAGQLKSWGLIPAEKFRPFRLDEPLRQLIARFCRILGCMTLPGMVDQLDWTALAMLREVLFQRSSAAHASDPAARIREAALYLQHHCDQALSCDDVAARFGFSHAAFFREWKKQFELSPQNYILTFRLRAAAHRLVQTDLPISAIAGEVHFSNLTAFHRKFREAFGVSPNAFRKDPNRWETEFSGPDDPLGRPS